MDNKWLIDNGTTLGNALMSGVGLAFAIGAPGHTLNAPRGNKFVLTV